MMAGNQQQWMMQEKTLLQEHSMWTVMFLLFYQKVITNSKFCHQYFFRFFRRLIDIKENNKFSTKNSKDGSNREVSEISLKHIVNEIKEHFSVKYIFSNLSIFLSYIFHKTKISCGIINDICIVMR